jgi:hypothetical protein
LFFCDKKVQLQLFGLSSAYFLLEKRYAFWHENPVKRRQRLEQHVYLFSPSPFLSDLLDDGASIALQGFHTFQCRQQFFVFRIEVQANLIGETRNRVLTQMSCKDTASASAGSAPAK